MKKLIGIISLFLVISAAHAQQPSTANHAPSANVTIAKNDKQCHGATKDCCSVDSKKNKSKSKKQCKESKASAQSMDATNSNKGSTVKSSSSCCEPAQSSSKEVKSSCSGGSKATAIIAAPKR